MEKRSQISMAISISNKIPVADPGFSVEVVSTLFKTRFLHFFSEIKRLKSGVVLVMGCHH